MGRVKAYWEAQFGEDKKRGPKRLTHKDLKGMKKDLTELQRGETVAAYIRKCDEQTANGDIAGAYKTLELASRLDAGNPDIERMMARVKPKYERMESQRRANLSSDEVYKERGDDAFKNAQFEGELISRANSMICVNVHPSGFSLLGME